MWLSEDHEFKFSWLFKSSLSYSVASFLFLLISFLSFFFCWFFFSLFFRGSFLIMIVYLGVELKSLSWFLHFFFHFRIFAYAFFPWSFFKFLYFLFAQNSCHLLIVFLISFLSSKSCPMWGVIFRYMIMKKRKSY